MSVSKEKTQVFHHGYEAFNFYYLFPFIDAIIKSEPVALIMVLHTTADTIMRNAMSVRNVPELPG